MNNQTFQIILTYLLFNNIPILWWISHTILPDAAPYTKYNLA